MPKKIGKRGCVIRMLLVILIGLLDLTPLGARTASAQTSPAPILSAVSPSRIALGGLIELIIEDLNAKVVQDKYDPNELHLSLNDYVLQGLKPDSIDLTTNKVRFRLIRTAADKTAWTDLLGAPPIDGQREVTVGLTLDPTHRVNTGPKLPTTVTLEIFSPLRLAIGMVLLAIMIVGLIYLARTTDIVRDSQPTVLETGTRRPYRDLGLREKAVENHLLEGRSIELCRNGSSQEAGAAGRNRNRKLDQRIVLEQRHLGFGGGVDEREELPGVYRSPLGFEFGLERIGKRQIHIVAAQKNVFSNADAFELQRTVAVGYGD